MAQTVILHHRLPNGESHYDWMIDQPNQQVEHRLITFRCETRPDFLPPDGLIVEKLPDHRAFFLNYQGPLSQDRGIVSRVAQGTAQIRSHTKSLLEIELNWSTSLGKAQVVHLTPLDPSTNLWQVSPSSPY